MESVTVPLSVQDKRKPCTSLEDLTVNRIRAGLSGTLMYTGRDGPKYSAFQCPESCSGSEGRGILSRHENTKLSSMVTGVSKTAIPAETSAPMITVVWNKLPPLLLCCCFLQNVVVVEFDSTGHSLHGEQSLNLTNTPVVVVIGYCIT